MTATFHAERYMVAPGDTGEHEIVDTDRGEIVAAFSRLEDAEKHAQRKNALISANSKRVAAGRFKKGLSSLPTDEAAREFASFLRGTPPPTLAQLRVFDSLTAINYIGKSKASKLLVRIGVQAGATRRVCELTYRQRIELAFELEELADRYLWNRGRDA